MEHDLVLTFCDPITKKNEYDIPFVLSNNSTSIKWLKLLYDDIYITKCDWSNNRFVGFDDPTESLNKFKDEMNEIIYIKDDPRSCIGWLPLAHSLIPNIKEIIQPRQYLKNIKIFEEKNDYRK